jgi:hypothetical protein
MSSEKIICRIYDEPSIKVAVYDNPKITVKFSDQGLKGDKGATGATGPAGSAATDHSLLSNLDYAHAGHTGFQKALSYVTEYKAYLVE